MEKIGRILNDAERYFEVNSQAKGSDLAATVSALNNMWSAINNNNADNETETTRSILLAILDVYDMMGWSKKSGIAANLARIAGVGDRLFNNVIALVNALEESDSVQTSLLLDVVADAAVIFAAAAQFTKWNPLGMAVNTVSVIITALSNSMNVVPDWNSRQTISSDEIDDFFIAAASYTLENWINSASSMTEVLNNFFMQDFNIWIDKPIELTGSSVDDSFEIDADQKYIIFGNAGNDSIIGARYNDTLYGGLGNDTIYGGEGGDYLNGGTGNDYISGGEGNDTIVDEQGTETYVFNSLSSYGHDTIYDLEGEGDIIIDGIIIRGGTKLNPYLWLSADGNFQLKVIADFDGVTTTQRLVITKINNDDNSVTVKFWKNNDLGINLTNNNVMTPDEIITGIGTTADDLITNSVYMSRNGAAYRDVRGDASYLYDYNTDVYLVDARGGNDSIILDGKNYDIYVGGGDLNKVITGDGNNVIKAENGSDQIFTGAGKDLIRLDKLVALSLNNSVNPNQVLPHGYKFDPVTQKINADWWNFASSGAGNDTILGGYAKDIIYAGDDSDFVVGAGGSDELHGEKGNDFIYGDSTVILNYERKDQRFLLDDEDPTASQLDLERVTSPYLIEGVLGNYLATNFAYQGNDRIYADEGDDIVFAGGGADIVYGGEGNDTISADSMRLFYLNLSNLAVSTQDQASIQNALIQNTYTYSGNDTIYGGKGNDKLLGGLKDDTLYGEDDNDIIYGDSDLFNSFHVEAYGGFVTNAQSIFNYQWNFARDLTSRFVMYDQLVDTNGNPLWTASDTIDGGKGNDEIWGEEGNDTITGGEDDDTIFGDALQAELAGKYHGNDKIWGEDGNDTIYGDGGQDEISGGEGNDTLYGDGYGLDGQWHKEDKIWGDAGNDTIIAGGGNDFIYGGIGNDIIRGDDDALAEQWHGDDQIFGESGSDIILAGAGNDTVDGGEDNDQLFGGNGNDTLKSGQGLDMLFGQVGDDLLEGGLGDDQLFGGIGNDTYVFNIGDGSDTIIEELNDIKALTDDNVIHFNFAASEVRQVSRDFFDLVIKYGESDEVRVQDYFKIRITTNSTYLEGYEQFENIEISEFRFNNGIVWNTQDIMQMAPPPEQNELPPDPLEGVAYFVDAMVDRETIKVKGKTTVTYSFASSLPNGSNVEVFNSAQQVAIQQALSKYSQLLNIQFVQVAPGSSVDFTFYLDDLTSGGRGGAAGYASAQTGEIHLNSLYFTGADSLNPGNDGFEVLLHEIGHAMGLKHPFEAPVLPEAENNQNNTVMSYTSNNTHDVNLQLFDIAALQYLHGINLSTRTDNTSYSFNDKYIWDSAGVDTFDASAQTSPVTIDLNEGGWSYVGSKNASILAAGQSFVGYGTKIENAVAGSGNDVLIANKLNNLLQGGLGQDSYRVEGGGQDKIIEVDGNNSLELTGLTASQIFSLAYTNQKVIYGNNSLEFDASKFDHIRINDRDYTYSQFIEAFSGSMVYFESNTILNANEFNGALTGTGNYSLTGNDKNNKLVGNSGNNTLDGSSGLDVMGGYLGDDIYIIDNVGDIVVEDAWEGNDSVISNVDYTLSENVENLKITGSALKAIGNEEDNIIEGNDNNNILDGGFGSDTMTGGLGDDIYYVDNNFENVIENQDGGNDTIVLSYEPHGAWLADYVENLILADNVVNATANYLDNVITGNAKNNMLEGMEGKDTYIFKQGSGQDTIVDEEGDITIQFQDVQPSAIQFVLPEAEVVQKWSYDHSYRYNSLEPSNTDLTIKYGNDSILLQNFFANTNSLKIVFPSGEEWSKNQILQRITYTAHGDATVSSIQGYAKIKNYITTSYDEGVSISAGVLDDTIYAGKGDDYIYVSTGNNIVHAGEGNDNIDAGNGNNLIYADKGDDYIKLGNGNQVVYAGEGDDHLILGSGNHSIQGDDGNDIIELGSGSHTVHGNQGNDNITLGDGQHQVYGDDGDDSIHLSQFSGIVHGGDGDDSISIHYTDDQTLYGDAGNDYISFSSGDNNTLIGGAGNDTLFAGSGSSNLVLGGEGDDRLGAATASVLDGGVGYDTYLVSKGGNDTILDADLQGGISLNAEQMFFKWVYSPIYGTGVLAQGPEESLAQLVSEQSGPGWSRTDYQYTRFNSRLGSISYNAATGDLILSKDQDIYFTLKNIYTVHDLDLVKNMSVKLEGQAGYRPETSYNYWTYFNETNLSFSEFMDQGLVTATYTVNDDVIKGLTEFVGQANQGDVIYAGAGNDQINSGRGSSLIYGEDGDDIIIAPDSQALDIVYGGAGNDVIYTYDLNLDAQPNDIPYNQLRQLRGLTLGAYDDIISGGAGNDYIYLGSQTASASGDEGDDTLVAGSGGSRLDGGAGVDHLVGGTGGDIFVVDEFDTFEENDPNGGYDTLQIAQNADLNGTYLEAVTLTGQGDFYAKGNAADNQLTGNDGNNLLDGRTGSDTMTGGLGDDYYVVDVTDTVATDGDGNTYVLQGDQVNEDFDGGIDTIERWQDDRYISEDANGNPFLTSNHKHLQDNIENLVLKGDAKTAFGNDLDNIIYGNAQNNYIDGLDGNDTYVFAKGGATDTYSFNDDINAFNTLKITGYNTSDVFAQKQGNSVYFSFKNSSDHIWLSNYYVADSGGRTNKLDQIEFDSGVIWTQADIQALVDRAASNRAPTVTGSIPQIIANQGNSFNYTIASNVITDPDSWDSLNYKVTLTTQTNGQYNPIPSWLTFDPVTRTLSGTPPSNISGNTTFYFWGTDMYGLGTGTSFTLKVNPPNRAPVVANPIADQTVTDGKVFSYTIAANAFSDPDADTLIYSATLEDGSALPAWLSFNATTRTISGTSPDNSAPLNIKITAKDTGNLTVSDVFQLTFAVQNLTLNGTTSADTLYGGSGNDTLTGQGGNDILYGQSGNDTLDGGTGNDTMYGGKGDDIYVVDSASDIINENANEGTDTIQSSITYTLNATSTANVENLTLTGTTAINGTGNALNNTLIGNSGNNTLTGGVGNDWLDGAAGTNILVGGSGDDTYVLSVSTNTITEAANEGIDTVRSSITYTLGSTSNLENLILTGSSAINATGNSLNNILVGNSGNNILDGGTGADSLSGGLGNDTYTVDNAADVVTENLNEGTDLVQSNISYTLTANVENLTLTGSTTINGAGNALNNTITGNTGNNILDGGAGTDTLIGGTGNDTYIVDSTSDVVTEAASAGTDVVQSSATYTLSANVENLTLTGTAVINGTGNTLNNTITGNGAANILDGNSGTDILIGGDGNDTYIVDSTTDTLTETATGGMDTVQSSVTFTLGASSNIENLTLSGTSAINGTGNSLNNILIGNSANNTLTGGAGDDWLDGVAGTNTLVGGIGNDTYVVSVSTNTLTEATNEGTDTVQSSITYTLGNNMENLTLTGTTAINGTGNTLSNVLKGNSANNTLTGGTGNDTYQFDRNSAVDTIVENDSTSGNKDTLSFASDIAADQLWFVKSGNNLEVSVIGTSNKAVVKDWYLGNAYHVEELKSGNGLTLLDTQVQNLVSAMAGLTPPAAGQTTLPPEYQAQLNAVLAANWK